MANPTLENAYVIGKSNFDSWSQAFPNDTAGYLKVLPHPNQTIAFKDPFIDWQKDNQNYKNGQFSATNAQGTYYSSWGPSKELKVTLKMSELTQTQIDGLGIVQKGNGVIEWLNNEATPYDLLRAYNSLIPGPMLITEPGDTLKITLVNDLTDPTNLHTHGLHVSAKGEGDNVLVSVKPGESREINIPIPDNHFIGLDWYHPHLHGETADQVGSGLGALLSVNAPYNLPDLDKFNPVTSPIYTFAINTLGLQEVLRSPSPTDPLNQSTDANVKVPAGSPLQIFGQDSNGQNIYQLSDAPFEGYNAKPIFYNPAKPTGDAPQTLEYGGGGLAEPVENVIHTVNGQYNPTLELTTNQWDLFSFANMTTNAFHILQLVYDDGTQLIPQEVNLVGIDGDASGVVDVVRRQVTDFPVLNPGSRVAVQHLFDKPGTYYFISNPTEEIEDKQYVPTLIQGKKGFSDGHLIWGPQVLATVKVTGNPVDPNTNPQAPFPQAYDILTQQSKKIDDLINGPVDRERQFIWDANVGGALVSGRVPKDTDVSTFQGTYTINGRYFSSSEPANIPPLAMPMLGTTEIWNVLNRSGLPSASLPQATPPNIPLSEWHPFHIHQNDFTVLSINGIDVKDINDNYLSGVLSDTIALPPAYIKGTATKDNPYGQPFSYNPANPGDVANAQASEVKILMHFEDFPGSYVNHCHILFHEDAGMMMVLRPILNTKETWLGLSSDDTSGQVDLSRGNNPSAAGISLTPYGTAFNKGVDVAIADVNYKSKDGENKNVTDNVTDVITIQKSLDKPTDKFKVKVFDGATLIQKQESQTKIDGLDPSSLLTEINPFQNIAPSTNQIASVASGDIDGDGFSDIVVGLGGGIAPIIEIYSGQDYQLKARIAPFHHETFTGKINLAVGDVNGDNYDDIIVGEGSGGRGLVELYDGRKLNETATLSETPKDTAHHTALLSQDFQPYGTSYTGEVDVTSGYILQRPDEPNDATTQTNNANITTLAKGPVPQGQEQIQVYTFLGGDHVHDSTTTDPMAEQLRKEVSLTPTGNTQEISGTFADLPGLPKGEPVLYTRKQNGDYEIIHLGDQNKPESTAIAASTTTFTLKNVNKDIFIINSSGGGNPKLKVKLTGRNSNLVNELGVCVVDDDKGTIDGIAPGAAGYIQAALRRSQIIFSAIANNPNGFDSKNLTSLLKFNSGANLKFFLVRNSTIETVLAGGASSTDVIFADASTQKITDLGTDGFSLGWKVNSSSTEFNDLVVNIQSSNDYLPLGTGLQGKPEGEQFDFRGVTQLIKAEFVVNREAAFNNYIGFYKTADENGGIDTNGDGKADILPGQAGYTQAAINQRISDINLSVSNQGTAKFTANFQAGGIVVPFIVINEKLDALLDANTTNDPAVYFPFLGANSDKVDHIRMLGNNIIGFEDLPNGGDKDYNDVIVKVNLSLA
ncbi:MAG: DUF4114 domain-containing protein [Aulosira sp. ZfuVER01]|nr:multicopper oxidase domain-containing protein [Aulosira sp. ZfuVER01]MDZ7997473.1 multicopper oxidase domain-containing protein [Aulosira sp. DedVER01a]MDZ8055933.1 multicopper oxidase domain-containing protein [Aulosira sp. ZfuCHP01]